MNFYIYILYSPSGDRYYVSYTDDVARRLEEHNHLSEKSYTSKHRPWELRGNFLIGPDRDLAMKIEKHIKKQKSRKYIEEIIRRGSIDGLIKRYKPVGLSGPEASGLIRRS